MRSYVENCHYTENQPHYDFTQMNNANESLYDVGVGNEIQTQAINTINQHRKSLIVTSSDKKSSLTTKNNPVYTSNSSVFYKKPTSQSISDDIPAGYGGWHPEIYLSRQSRKQRAEKMGDEARKKAQIHAYVAWVNAQLKKKSGSRVIEELTTDLNDGVALLDLIEIVGGERLGAVHSAPSNPEEMLENVEKVLQFMQNRRIRMHPISAQDVVEGNTKSIMRLILALAAYFKPNSVKQSSHMKSGQGESMAGIAQGAAAALAGARQDAAVVSKTPQRPRPMSQQNRGDYNGSETTSDTSSLMSPTVLLEGVSNSPSSSSLNSPRYNGVRGSPNRPLQQSSVPKSKSVEFHSHNVQPDSNEASHFHNQILKSLTIEHAELANDVDSTKKTLLILQDLLLGGLAPDGSESPAVGVEAGNPEDEVVILRSKLQQSEELVKDLRKDLSNFKNECMQLQGVKAGLQQRLSEQEHSFLVLKADLLRAGFRQQTLEKTKVEMEDKLIERDELVLDLRRDLSKREREIDELKANFTIEQQQRDSSAKALKSQIQDLHGKLQRVGQNEATLSARVASQDRKMARLEGTMIQTQYETASTGTRLSSGRSTHSTSSDDMQMVKDNLQSLRTHFHSNKSQHHVIDELECSISVLMERLQMCETDTKSNVNTRDTGSRTNYDSTGDSRRSPLSAIHGFPAHRLDVPSNGSSTTKILYFTDRTVTPFMCSISKRLGEITLRDVKTVVDKPGNYRYHFKAVDPEFGTVKEEVVHDDDVIPGWEGKIIAWIEEDH